MSITLFNTPTPRGAYAHRKCSAIVPRLMCSASKRSASVLPGVIALLVLATSTLGCDELRARRTIQKADELYRQSRYRQAAEQYETALELADIPIGHHNAALAYYRAFVPGDESPENKHYGERAAFHFEAYLKAEPPESKKIPDKLTDVWVNSKHYDKALEYWQG